MWRRHGRASAAKILGVSAHSVEEVHSAAAAGADYVGLGPIYATVSKADANTDRLGVAGTSAMRHFQLAIVAIGGINLERAPAVFAAGADGIAVISAICRKPSAAQVSAIGAVNAAFAIFII